MAAFLQRRAETGEALTSFVSARGPPARLHSVVLHHALMGSPSDFVLRTRVESRRRHVRAIKQPVP